MLRALAMLVVLLASAGAVAAQSDRARAVRLIVPFAPGGQVDLMARLIAENLSKHTGRTIVVDNRAGASGLIAMQIAMTAAPDAHTLVFGSASTMALLPHADEKPPYDPIKDFTPISLVASSPYVLVVNASGSARSVGDLIKLAKAKPGELTFGSAGHLSGTRVTTELFNEMAGVNTTHISFKGSGPATIALLSGQVSFLFNNVLPSLPHIAAGKLRALGVTSTTRNRALPDVPTIAETGVRGFESGAWNGLVAPGRPPAAEVEALYKGVVASLAAPQVRSSILEQGSEVIGSTPVEFSAFIKRENAKWAAVIRKLRPQ